MEPNKRKCPKCGKEITHKDKKLCKRADRQGTPCRNCCKDASFKKYKRICPKCGKDVRHSSQYNCEKYKEKLCQSCIKKVICSRPDYKEKHKGFIERYCTKGNVGGNNNPFYGHKHTSETIAKLKAKDVSYTKTWIFRNAISKAMSGSKNPMYNKTYYQIWVDKYGKEKADELQKAKREHNSEASSGEKNPMYGKPSPQGAGNGWSGWYKGWFFRSLKELSYVVGLDKNSVSWRTAEFLSIKYTDWQGKARTYRPDFIVGNKIIEVKPSKLKLSPIVKLKKEAADEFCRKNGYEFEIIDPPTLSDQEIAILRINGIIKFTDRYEKMFEERQNNAITI